MHIEWCIWIVQNKCWAIKIRSILSFGVQVEGNIQWMLFSEIDCDTLFFNLCCIIIRIYTSGHSYTLPHCNYFSVHATRFRTYALYIEKEHESWKGVYIKDFLLSSSIEWCSHRNEYELKLKRLYYLYVIILFTKSFLESHKRYISFLPFKKFTLKCKGRTCFVLWRVMDR